MGSVSNAKRFSSASPSHLYSSFRELPKGCNVFEGSFEFTRRPEGCEADDKKLRIVSTRLLESEDIYLSLWEFA